LFPLVCKTSEWVWWAALSCYQRVARFQGYCMLNRLAGMAMLDARIGGGVNAAGVQLT
jgi:hypothetical protein